MAQCEFLQGQKDFLQPLLGGLMDQVAVGVELCRRLECLHEKLRFVDEMEVQENSDLP